uniref:Peroxisomal carnitine O-octanoyltransferase n=1 Tax=Callorhinchus milii TaxID=7868 RepID=A0A4W3JD44_CALMI
MDGQMFESNEERTFQYQDSLPPLPVPNLCQSITKYLDSVKPFLTHEELQTTTQIAKRFLSGQGAELHAKLHSWAKDKRNWLEEWWLNSAYLDNREPTMLNVNFAGAAPYLEHYWEPKEGTQVERPTSFISLSNLRQQLAVHKSGAAPFDMDQFRMLYCTCRIPGETRDSIVNYFQTEEEGPCPSHLIVQCRGRVFVFNTLVNEQILTPPEIFRQLTFIRELCGKEPEGPGVSALTSEARTKWAKAREYLISLDPTNVTVLELIQNSLFVLSLDDTSPNVSPEDYSEICAASLTGNPTVRWGDKSYNCLSFANGTFGSNCDHSPYDAMVMVSLCYYIDLQVKSIEGKWQGSKAIRDIPLPEELIFVVDEKILEDIEQAKQQYQKQVCRRLVLLSSTRHAAIPQHNLPNTPHVFITSRLDYGNFLLVSLPNSLLRKLQIIQNSAACVLSCTRLRGPITPTLARLHWLPIHQRIEFKIFHHELMTEAQVGKGFDRHLLGLLQIAKEEGLPVPELYTDIGFTRSGGGGNFVLSTSLVGYTTVLGAVVPMVRNGYGFFYRIRDDRIVVACSAWKSSPETNAEELYKAVSLSFQEMVQMVSKSQL